MGDNIDANANFFDGYQPKGLNRKQAQLLYNVGLNAADIQNPGAGPVGQRAATFDYTPAHADAVGTGVLTRYDLTTDAGIMNYVAARSLDKDPLNGDGNQN